MKTTKGYLLFLMITTIMQIVFIAIERFRGGSVESILFLGLTTIISLLFCILVAIYSSDYRGE